MVCYLITKPHFLRFSRLNMLHRFKRCKKARKCCLFKDQGRKWSLLACVGNIEKYWLRLLDKSKIYFHIIILDFRCITLK